jgi:hypothetical protein
MAGGFGSVALAAEMDPFAARAPHFAPKAKHIIYLIMNGGMSQVDTFDPKPALDRYHGQPMPGEQVKTERITGSLMRSPFSFKKHGQSGIEVSEIFPNIARNIDKFTVIRSMHTDVPNHEPSLFMMNCGTIQPGRPSLGSWLTYGLGTENRNLPGYVVLCPGTPVVGPPLWESAFLPAVFQGTFIKATEKDPRKLVQFLERGRKSAGDQRRQLDLLKELNTAHLVERAGDSNLEAAIQSMETAFRMQTEVPEVFDVMKEPEAVRTRYGDSDFGRGCLMALRLVEKGVRMVQIYYGNSQPWDSHEDIQAHKANARRADPAVGALVEDLAARGLLDETLVVFGTEFGRTPAVENSSLVKLQNGRDHNSAGYSILLPDTRKSPDRRSGL